jgi:hypothetical protein
VEWGKVNAAFDRLRRVKGGMRNVEGGKVNAECGSGNAECEGGMRKDRKIGAGRTAHGKKSTPFG